MTTPRSFPNDNTTAHPAHLYDAGVRQVIPHYDAIHAETLDLIRSVVGEPALWLDTGCGTGALVERALPRFPRTRFALADPSDAMLGQARERFRREPGGRVTVLPATGSNGLPAIEPRLRAQVVSAVLCHHYLDPEGRAAAVRGCFEVLEPGGALVVVENVDADSERGRELGLRRWRDFQIAQGRSPEAVAQHLARFGTELKPVRVAEHLAVLRAAGFSTVELFWRAQMQAGFLAVK